MKRFITLAVLLAAISTVPAQSKLTYVDLVKRLTDLEHLATLPEPGETTRQWSSYDRASQFDEATGKYVKWDANGDGTGFIRKEGNQLVIAEMEGPGCIWRIWSAETKVGHVRIYLDGASEPAVDLPWTDYFNGKAAPFNRSALVHHVAKGWNNYTPIPYQKSCKIVADEGWGKYYEFVYTTFAKGTQVPTFKRELSAEEKAALDEASNLLSKCGPLAATKDHKTLTREFVASEGSVMENLKGPAAITSIRAKLESTNPGGDRDALRQLVLQIKWDGESKPSVWVPLGDFFGTAPGANPYKSYPCGLTEDGWFYANWFMPFAKSAEVTLVNDGKVKDALRVKIEVSHKSLKGDLAKYGRFHAKWHRDAFLPKEPERAIDWTMLKTTGRGRFAGVMLHVWNSRGGWWGEGDEKFFVDGEKFPSTIGTGSEDYFGYAWCSSELFQNAYHNQTYNDGNSRGHISVNRWHIPDQIPFQKSFEGCIEKYYPNNRPTLYASTVYWYLEPGGNDRYEPVPVTERLGYYVLPNVKRVPGAIEGETMKVIAKTAGPVKDHDTFDHGDHWSGGAQLRWLEATPGDKLDLALPVPQKGKFRLLAQFTRSPRYGIFQLSLDGKKLGEPIDLHHTNTVVSGEQNLGTHELAAGEHKFSVEILGANPKGGKKYMFGLDYLRLEPF